MVFWRGFLRAHDHVIRMLDLDLRNEMGMTISEFEVLVQLSLADGERMRMRDLARSTLFSPSGMTRLCERLEDDGMVVREGSADDQRGTDAVLTDRGRERLRAAEPVHARGIKTHFTCFFSADEMERFSALLHAVTTEQPTDR